MSVDSMISLARECMKNFNISACISHAGIFQLWFSVMVLLSALTQLSYINLCKYSSIVLQAKAVAVLRLVSRRHVPALFSSTRAWGVGGAWVGRHANKELQYFLPPITRAYVCPI